MVEPLTVRLSPEYRKWRANIKDELTGNRIDARVFRLESGLFGDTRAVGGGLSELKLDFGPGFRIYFARRGMEIVVLLCGGDKSSQTRDVAAAHAIWERRKDSL